MKITIEHYKEKITWEHEFDDLDLDDLHGVWERLLVAMSFTPEQVKDFYSELK